MKTKSNDAVSLPRGWRDKLRLIYQYKWQYQDEKEFLLDDPLFQYKTLRRAELDGEMSGRMFDILLRKTGYFTRQELLSALKTFKPPSNPVLNATTQRDNSPLDSSTSAEYERKYVALARSGLYDDAAALAQRALACAKDFCLQAHWADRMADAYRSSGMLWEASEFYGLATNHISRALKENPADLDLRYQQGKTRFGQIMVDAYLIRGAFGEAHSRHEQLLKEVDALLLDVQARSLKADIALRRIHVKRQQAEMLRLLGRYGEGLKLIREVFSEYPESSYEARSYSRLSEADFLRLQGNARDALVIYEDLEKFARPEHRDLPGLLGSVLWRKSGVLQCLKNEDGRAACLHELKSLADKHAKRYHYVAIYSSLVQASGKVADVAKASNALLEMEKTYKLRPEYLVTEYAHLCLCRGELSRTGGKSDSGNWFQKAYDCYLRMECRWGLVRAWAGNRLAGGKIDFPKRFKSELEGLDAKLLSDFEAGRISVGCLSLNIP